MDGRRTKSNDVTTLTFRGAEGSAEILVHRDVVLRIAGSALFAGGPVMAQFANGAWHVGDQRLERISIKGPVRVEFHNGSRARIFGPFSELSLVDDVALEGNRLLARYRPLDKGWDFFGDADAAEAPVVPPSAVLTPT
jgi:hypothetical protein